MRRSRSTKLVSDTLHTFFFFHFLFPQHQQLQTTDKDEMIPFSPREAKQKVKPTNANGCLLFFFSSPSPSPSSCCAVEVNSSPAAPVLSLLFLSSLSFSLLFFFSLSFSLHHTIWKEAPQTSQNLSKLNLRVIHLNPSINRDTLDVTPPKPFFRFPSQKTNDVSTCTFL